jgi:hypothetical protein
MRVVHDWEFLEEGNSVYPISVGMVREDGAELYYEFIDAPWEKILKHNWLKENVIPALSKSHNQAIVMGEGNAITKGKLAIRMKVYAFLEEAAKDSPLELWGWYSAYDHVCLGQLFGAMVNLPDFVPMWTNEIKQEVYKLGDPKIPDLRKPEEIVHNALDDARAEMRMLEYLDNFELIHSLFTGNSRGIQYGKGNVQ